MNSLRWITLVGVIGTCLAAGRGAVAEAVVTVPAQQKRVVTTVSAPARVQAVSNAVLSAPAAGIVTGLQILPGERVRPGQALARLTGPMVAAQRARLAADLKTAQIRVSAATQAAAIEQQKFAEQLSTRGTLARARAELDTARQQRVAAQSATRSYAGAITVATSEPAVVTAVSVADGQYVSAGQALITVTPTRGLHVVADFYGAEAASVRAGMKGRFQPEGGHPPRGVIVQRLAWSVAAPGRLQVWFGAATGADLAVGTIGAVSLTVADDQQLVIPSTALVLDNGQWWVLVRDKSGNHRRHVVPGPSQGDWTSIRQGLSPGQRVVTQDAYLLFHQDFAKRYQQTD